MASQSKELQTSPTSSMGSQSEDSSTYPPPTIQDVMPDTLDDILSLTRRPREFGTFLPIFLPLLIFCKLFWAAQTTILIVVCFCRSSKQKDEPQESKDEELLQLKAELTPLPSSRRSPLLLKWVEDGSQKSEAQDVGADQVELHAAERRLLKTSKEFVEVDEAIQPEKQVPSNIIFKHPSAEKLLTTDEYVPPAKHVEVDKDVHFPELVHLPKNVHTDKNNVFKTGNILEFDADIPVEVEKSPRKQLLELGIGADELDDIAEQLSSQGGWSNPKPLQSDGVSNNEDNLPVLDTHTPVIFDEVDSFLSSICHQGTPQTSQQDVSHDDSEFKDVPLDDESSPLTTTRFSDFEKIESFDMDNFLDNSLVDGSTLVAGVESPSKQGSFITTTKTLAESEAAVRLKLDQIQPVIEVDQTVYNVQLEEHGESASHLDLSKSDNDVPSALDEPREKIDYEEQHLGPIAQVIQAEDTELSEANPSGRLLQDVPSLTRAFKEINELLASTQSLPMVPPSAKLPEGIIPNEYSPASDVQPQDFTVHEDEEDITHPNESEVSNIPSEIPAHVKQVDEILDILSGGRESEASPERTNQADDDSKDPPVIQVDELEVSEYLTPKPTLPPNHLGSEDPAEEAPPAELFHDESRQSTPTEIAEDRDNGLVKQGKEFAVTIWRDEEDETEVIENADSVNKSDSGILYPIEGNEQRRGIVTNAEEALVEELKKKHSKSAYRRWQKKQIKTEALKVTETDMKPVAVSEAAPNPVTSQSSAAVIAEQAALGSLSIAVPEVTPAKPEIAEPTAAPSTDAQIKKQRNKDHKARAKANKAKTRAHAQLERILRDDANKAKSHGEIVSMLVRLAVPLDLEKIARFWSVDGMVREAISSSGSAANVDISMSTQVLDEATQHVQEPEFGQPLGIVEANRTTQDEPQWLAQWYEADEPVPGWRKLSPEEQFELVRQGGVPNSGIQNEPFPQQFWEVDRTRSALRAEADVFTPYAHAASEWAGYESEYGMTAEALVNNFPPHFQAALHRVSQDVRIQSPSRNIQGQIPTMHWSPHEDSSSSGYLGYHILPHAEPVREANYTNDRNQDPATTQPAVNNFPPHLQVLLNHTSQQIRVPSSSTNIQSQIPAPFYPLTYVQNSHTPVCPGEYYLPPNAEPSLLEADKIGCGGYDPVTPEPALNNFPLHIQSALNHASQKVRNQPVVNNLPLHLQAALADASQQLRSQPPMSNGQASGHQHPTQEHIPTKQVRFVEEVELEQVQRLELDQVNETAELIQGEATPLSRSESRPSIRFGQFPHIDIEEARKAGSCMPQVKAWNPVPESSPASPAPAPFHQVDENEGVPPRPLLSLPRPSITFGQFPDIDIKKARVAGSCIPQVKSWLPLPEPLALPSQTSFSQSRQEPVPRADDFKQEIAALHSHRLGRLAQSIELEKRLKAAKPRRRSFHDWQSLHPDRYGPLDMYGEDGELCHENSSHENCARGAWCWNCKKLLDGLVLKKEYDLGYAGELVATC